MRDMNRDGAGDADREPNEQGCDSDGEHNDRDRHGAGYKSFEEGHQSKCASGF